MKSILDYFAEFVTLFHSYPAQTLAVVLASVLGGYFISRHDQRQRNEELDAKERLGRIRNEIAIGAQKLDDIKCEIERKTRQIATKKADSQYEASSYENGYPGSFRQTGLYFPEKDNHSEEHLKSIAKGASRRIRIFGLTRNFYTNDKMRSTILERANEIPIDFYIMNPMCVSRIDRYRVEPPKAAFDNITKYIHIVEAKYIDMLAEARRSKSRKPGAGIRVFYYNFPCQLSAEQFDDTIRYSIYGIREQGDASPIWVSSDINAGDYKFIDRQLNFLEAVALGGVAPDAVTGLRVVPIEDEIQARRRLKRRQFMDAHSVRAYLSNARAVDALYWEADGLSIV